MDHQLDTLPSAQPARSPSATPSPLRSRNRNERGFTLVEAMVALVLCTIGLMSLAQLMVVTLQMQQLGRNSTSAIAHGPGQDRRDSRRSVLPRHRSSAADRSTPTSPITTTFHREPTTSSAAGSSRSGPDDAVTSASTSLTVSAPVTVRVIPDLNDRRT